MALDGTYNIKMKSPMGDQEGSFTFKTEGEVLLGTASAAGTTTDIHDGKVNGDSFECKFEMKSPMGKIKITVRGTIEGNRISGSFKMLVGSFPFEGTKAS